LLQFARETQHLRFNNATTWNGALDIVALNSSLCYCAACHFAILTLPAGCLFPLTHTAANSLLAKKTLLGTRLLLKGGYFCAACFSLRLFSYQRFKIYDSASRVILRNEHATSILIMDIAILNVELSVIYGLLKMRRNFF
jgi:hypothetical protein